MNIKEINEPITINCHLEIDKIMTMKLEKCYHYSLPITINNLYIISIILTVKKLKI